MFKVAGMTVTDSVSYFCVTENFIVACDDHRYFVYTKPECHLIHSDELPFDIGRNPVFLHDDIVLLKNRYAPILCEFDAATASFNYKPALDFSDTLYLQSVNRTFVSEPLIKWWVAANWTLMVVSVSVGVQTLSKCTLYIGKHGSKECSLFGQVLMKI